MSAQELWIPIDSYVDDDTPDMIHLVHPDAGQGPQKALCGYMTKGIEVDMSVEDPDCVVCVAEAERQGFHWK